MKTLKKAYPTNIGKGAGRRRKLPMRTPQTEGESPGNAEKRKQYKKKHLTRQYTSPQTHRQRNPSTKHSHLQKK